MAINAKNAALIQLIVVAILNLAASIYFFLGHLDVQEFSSDDVKKKPICKGSYLPDHTLCYNPVVKHHLNNSECHDDLGSYYRGISAKLMIPSAIVVFLAASIWALPDKTRLNKWLVGIFTTLIHKGLFTADLISFDYGQKDRMTVHDIWICFNVTIHVKHAIFFNAILYIVLGMHLMGSIFNILIFTCYYLCNAGRCSEKEHDDTSSILPDNKNTTLSCVKMARNDTAVSLYCDNETDQPFVS